MDKPIYLACSSVNSVRWESNADKWRLATNSSISLGIKYTSDLYRPAGALNNSEIIDTILLKSYLKTNVIILIYLPYDFKISNFSNIPISARAWVHVVIDTTNDGTDEHDRLTRLPSAKRTIRFPFGQMMWSTYNTFSVRDL